jgi:hypothetical protein
MNLKIGRKALNETVKCGNDFACLSSEKNCLCKVEDNLDNKIVFIKPIKKSACNYRMSFGYSFVCSCPTRKEIYKQYKI